MNEVVYIGFWKRFIGFLVNSVLIALMMSPLGAILFKEIKISDYDLADQQQVIALLAAMSRQSGIEIAVAGTLFVLFWIFRNSEPGKMIFRAVIVDASSHAPATSGQYLLRYLGYYISLIPFGLGFLWVGIDPRKQGWHDKIASTVVIKIDSTTADPS